MFGLMMLLVAPVYDDTQPCRIKHLLSLSAYCTAVKVMAQVVHDLVQESGAHEVRPLRLIRVFT